jgi:predicted SnoaL-like aldol condensation-catalyzing enzyme
MSEANKELVRRHFEQIWNNKDLAAADELMAQDYLEHAVAPFGQVEPGRVDGPAARQSNWFRVEGGRLAEHWATREDLVAMLQLGVVQPPSRPPT